MKSISIDNSLNIRGIQGLLLDAGYQKYKGDRFGGIKMLSEFLFGSRIANNRKYSSVFTYQEAVEDAYEKIRNKTLF